MVTDRTMKWIFLILVSMNMWIYSDFAFSGNVGFPNLQSSGEMPISQNTQQEFCDSLFPSLKDLKELCQVLELENLSEMSDFPGVTKLDAENLRNFAHVAQGHIRTFTDPEKFKKSATNPDLLVRMLGFDDVSQLAKVEAGAAVVIKDVLLHILQNFKFGNDFQGITHEKIKVAIPLYVREDGMGKQGRSMLIFGLSKKNGEWVLIQRGISRRYQRMFKYQKNETLLIDVSGLGQRFLAKDANGKLQLIPLENAKFEQVELEAGVAQPAEKIFAGLAPEAKKIIKEDSESVQTQNRKRLR